MAMTLRGPRVCRAVLVVAATAEMLIGTQAAAAAAVPQDVPSPCAGSARDAGVVPGHPARAAEPALDPDQAPLPGLSVAGRRWPADPADGLGAAGPPGTATRASGSSSSPSTTHCRPSGQALGRGLDIARVDGQVVNASSGV